MKIIQHEETDIGVKIGDVIPNFTSVSGDTETIKEILSCMSSSACYQKNRRICSRRFSISDRGYAYCIDKKGRLLD